MAMVSEEDKSIFRAIVNEEVNKVINEKLGAVLLGILCGGLLAFVIVVTAW